jgi:transcriptional regulator with XRE-family HTH domain
MSTLDFGSYIREIRKSRGLGLRQAAAQLGINPSYLSRVETNVSPPPSKDILVVMARVYKIPISDLVTRLRAERTETSSLDPVAAALYRIAMSAPAADRIRMLERAVNDLNLPDETKEWWRKELSRLRTELQLGDGPGLLREPKAANDIYDQYAIPRRLRASTIESMALTKLRSYLGGDLSTYKPPTPIEEVIEFEDGNIDLALFDASVGGSLPDGTPRVLGRCRWITDGRIEIGIDERLFNAEPGSPARRRGNFTLGHEYFHAVEHLPRLRQFVGLVLNRDLREVQIAELNTSGKRARKSLSTNEDWREFQANTFSAAILMPSEVVQREFHSRFGEYSYAVPESELMDACMTFAELADASVSLASLFDVNPQAMAIRLQTLGLVIEE